ncbi:hypothetical protein [Streptomyces sp. NPDC050422]|uniref:hypothetical protein n=1 Tax=Streptomyces sp. NPDC050422 TaxID=3365614 RepID=UPI0037B1C121
MTTLSSLVRPLATLGSTLIGQDHVVEPKSGAKVAVGDTMTIADGSYHGTGLVIRHRCRKGARMKPGRSPLRLPLGIVHPEAGTVPGAA